VSVAPELVYFPADFDAIAGTHAKIHWTAGGQFPDLAVWHVRSTDNHDFIVGLDRQVYQAQQLPLAKGASGLKMCAIPLCCDGGQEGGLWSRTLGECASWLR